MKIVVDITQDRAIKTLTFEDGSSYSETWVEKECGYGTIEKCIMSQIRNDFGEDYEFYEEIIEAVDRLDVVEVLEAIYNCR